MGLMAVKPRLAVVVIDWFRRLDHVSADGQADLLRDDLAFGRFGFRQHDDEPIGAAASHLVLVPDRLPDAVGRPHEHQVTHPVPHGGVDPGKIVQVHQQDEQFVTVPAATGQFVHDRPLHAFAVEQVGQRIHVNQPVQPGGDFGQFPAEGHFAAAELECAGPDLEFEFIGQQDLAGPALSGGMAFVRWWVNSSGR